MSTQRHHEKTRKNLLHRRCNPKSINAVPAVVMDEIVLELHGAPKTADMGSYLYRFVSRPVIGSQVASNRVRGLHGRFELNAQRRSGFSAPPQVNHPALSRQSGCARLLT